MIAAGGRVPPPLAAAAAAAGLLVLSSAPFERGPLLQAPHVSRDSLDIREEMEDRQEEFEERRRSHLETTWGRPVTRCDEVVGRFCLWHSEDRSWEPPEEPGPVREARRRLVTELDSAARRIPGDPWIAGQRVRYLLEDGRIDAALEAAGACRAAGWWCRALAGLVHHRAGRYGEAEDSFGSALEAMGRERACRWRDLRDLLDGDARDRLDDRSCAGREPLEERIWWLADPFYLVRGNDRRSEHFSRWVLDRTQRDAETPSGVRWGEDLQELLVRYGWPVGWERDVSTDDPGTSVISHYPDPARRWMPDRARHVTAPDSITENGWPLDPPDPRSEYSPRYVRAFGTLHALVSRFRRGDSALVVAAYELEPEAVEGEGRDADTVPVRGWVRSGLFVDRGPDRPASSTTSRTQGRKGVLAVRSGAGGRLLSLEVLAPTDSVAARRRHGVQLSSMPEEGVAVSDLMLVEAGADTLPAEPGEVIARARPTGVYRPGQRVGLYWEVYGPRGAVGGLRTSVSLSREDGGFLQDLGALLGLGGGGGEEVRMEWRDRISPARRVHPRSLVIRLPESLPGDRYTLRVTAAPATGDTVAASRRLRVRSGG